MSKPFDFVEAPQRAGAPVCDGSALAASLSPRVACAARFVESGSPDSAIPCEVQLPVEHALDVHAGDALLMRITCSPDHLEELVLGRLMTEGFIAGACDVAAVELSDDLSVARVTFAEGAAVRFPSETQIVPTYGTPSRSLSARDRACAERHVAACGGRSGVRSWSVEEVFALARVFADDTPVHHATNGSHSCYLVIDGELRYCCEDLGRHNALDKVIGSALKAGDDLSRALVFSSGRIPADMIGKVIRAGVPMLVTKAVPTDLAVRMAREAGIVLVCTARPDSLRVFNDPGKSL